MQLWLFIQNEDLSGQLQFISSHLLELGHIEIFPTQGLNLGLQHWRQMLFTIWAIREAHYKHQSIAKENGITMIGLDQSLSEWVGA